MKHRLLFLTISIVSIGLIFSACEKQDIQKNFQEPGIEKSAQNDLKSSQGQVVLNFRAHLSGDQVNVDPPLETEATGQAIFQLSKDGTELSYRLIVANIENVRMAHIHLAPAGENGPVVAWLYPSAPPAQKIEGRFDGNLATGVITTEDLSGPLDEDELSDLIYQMAAGNTYVNVHTDQYPRGEIRGQITGNTNNRSGRSN